MTSYLRLVVKELLLSNTPTVCPLILLVKLPPQASWLLALSKSHLKTISSQLVFEIINIAWKDWIIEKSV